MKRYGAYTELAGLKDRVQKVHAAFPNLPIWVGEYGATQAGGGSPEVRILQSLRGSYNELCAGHIEVRTRRNVLARVSKLCRAHCMVRVSAKLSFHLYY